MTDEVSERHPHYWLGVLALVVCAAVWSLNGPLIKLIGQEGVGGVTIACYRSLIGGLVFAPLALRRLRTLRLVSPAWPIGSVLMFTLMTVCFVVATTKTAAANAIILQYTSPIWVFLLSPLLLKEKPGWKEGLALLLALVGIGIIFSYHPTGEIVWLVVALGSGLGYGTLTVTLRGLRRVNPFVVATMNALGSGVILVMLVAASGTFAMTSRAWMLVILLSLVQFTLPYVLFSWALQRVEAYRAALIVLLETLLNPLWTYLIIGERVPNATLVGGPFILAGVITWLLLSWRRRQTLPISPTTAGDRQ
ncbi:MAG: DMT family transporter [Planctomycetota bacterium]